MCFGLRTGKKVLNTLLEGIGLTVSASGLGSGAAGLSVSCSASDSRFRFQNPFRSIRCTAASAWYTKLQRSGRHYTGTRRQKQQVENGTEATTEGRREEESVGKQHGNKTEKETVEETVPCCPSELLLL